MADFYLTFTLNLADAPKVHHHVNHKNTNEATWRVDSDAIYLHGTVEQLRAFGESVLAAATEYRTRVKPACPKCGSDMTFTATAPVAGAEMEWRCFDCVDLGNVGQGFPPYDKDRDNPFQGKE